MKLSKEQEKAIAEVFLEAVKRYLERDKNNEIKRTILDTEEPKTRA